ncbi:MAG: hypothetical protein IKS45_05575 [Thermoguttaceae bacterium]|nr:hypothetical protein [Thermoguttaceae bacterium]
MANKISNLIDAIYEKAIQGKNEEQRQILAYFFNKPKVAGGCFESTQYMSDEEFMDIVERKKQSLNLRQKAIDKIGLDEDQLSEMPPICFGGFTFKDASCSKKLKHNVRVSTCYQVSWLFFSSEQFYLYQYTFYLDEDKKKENTEEYFYSDVTFLATRTESETGKDRDGKTFEVEMNSLLVGVPGANFCISLEDPEKNFEDAIKRMRFKLREKKNM